MPSSRPASLKDIAKLAGVSIMTVSRALSGGGPVSAAKRAAVEAAAAQLGYLPNPVVRTLMSELRRGRAQAFRGTLAFLNASGSEPDWRTLPYLRPCWEAARERARELGFVMDDIWVAAPGWSPRRTLEVLHAREVRGVVVVPGGTEAQMDFALDRFAIASFGGLAYPLKVHQALPDRFHNYATCHRELWKLGHRRIGVFLPDYDLRISGEESLGGFLSAQWRVPARHHVPVGTNASSWTDAEHDFKRWVRKTRPDAVIVSHNHAERWLAEIGLHAPDDIGIAHVGLAGDVSDWSGINADLRAQGSQAIDLITAQIFRNERGLPAQAKTLTVKGTWVEGRTTRRR